MLALLPLRLPLLIWQVLDQLFITYPRQAYFLVQKGISQALKCFITLSISNLNQIFGSFNHLKIIERDQFQFKCNQDWKTPIDRTGRSSLSTKHYSLDEDCYFHLKFSNSICTWIGIDRNMELPVTCSIVINCVFIFDNNMIGKLEIASSSQNAQIFREDLVKFEFLYLFFTLFYDHTIYWSIEQ